VLNKDTLFQVLQVLSEVFSNEFDGGTIRTFDVLVQTLEQQIKSSQDFYVIIFELLIEIH
jgi:hypothetical protein